MSKRILILSMGVTVAFMLLYAYFVNLTRESPEPGEIGAGADDIDMTPNTNTTTSNRTSTRNFDISEFACHDGTPVPAYLQGNCIALMENLQQLRNRVGLPIFISSGYRTVSWNAKQPGSATNSMHLKAMAADIKIPGMSPAEVKNVIELLISEGRMSQGGIGLYPTFVHYDIRGTKQRW